MGVCAEMAKILKNILLYTVIGFSKSVRKICWLIEMHACAKAVCSADGRRRKQMAFKNKFYKGAYSWYDEINLRTIFSIDSIEWQPIKMCQWTNYREEYGHEHGKVNGE